MATAVVTENFKPQGKGHTKTQSRVQLEGLRDALGTQSLEQLRGMIRTLPGLVKDDDNLRQDVLNAIKQLQAEIETPWDTIQRIFLLNVSDADGILSEPTLMQPALVRRISHHWREYGAVPHAR